ncbi:MAG: ORF6N domain-containing protein [Candidatus Limimorpha sp.]
MTKKINETAEKQPAANCNPLSNVTAQAVAMQTDLAQLILNIRGVQVMIDRDLAMLYGVETRVLNQAVKRNSNRFPDDFLFRLTKEECIKSQIVTLNKGRGNHLKYLPYAFTEQGIAMLSGVLRSPTAIEVNIRIMRAFTAMRHFLANNAQIFQRLSNIEYHQIETDKRIDEIFKRLNANTQLQQGIFYDGQVFDAYCFASDLIRKAQKSIILFDNYVDDTVLSLLDKRNNGVSATIYTRQISKQLQLDIDRHNAQYPTINVRVFNKAHDRFLLIDKEMYRIGASIKDLGKKRFGFTLMRDITAENLFDSIKGE